MNQAILNLIDEEIEMADCYYVEPTLQRLRDKISSLPSDTQWIDVNKEKPDEGQEILASDGKYTMCCEYLDNEFRNPYEYSSIEHGIRYWKTLPLYTNN